MELNSKQKAYLRSLGQTLKVVVTVGDKGVSKSVIDSTSEVLEVRELIKISISHPDRNYRKEAIVELAEATESTVVNTIGKTALLFKENPENPVVSKKM
jgi:RNA-binding protein